MEDSHSGSLVEPALALVRAGISVLPCKADKSPQSVLLPGGSWKPFQARLPSETDIRAFFANGALCGAICGVVSGNLECIDLDEDGLSQQWQQILKGWQLADLLAKLVIEKSPSKGCYHIWYRHKGKPGGNLKLARKPDGACRIETRGEGGYAVCSPSTGYRLTQGSFEHLPVLSLDERDSLLSACRFFDQKPERYVSAPGEKAGDDFNARGSIAEVDLRGWKRVGDGPLWRRPGKSKGHSASWNHGGNRHFVVFSSNVPELSPGAYDLFGLYVRLNHGGDFGGAVKALSRAGYGVPAKQVAERKAQGLEAVRAPVRFRTLEGVKPEKVDWLLEPYIPLGEVSILAGDPGIGKSTIAQAIATAVTIGSQICSRQVVQGSVVHLCAEQGVRTITVPRFLGMGADMAKISCPDWEAPDGVIEPFILDAAGVQELGNHVADSNSRLVVIDTITAYYDASKSFNSNIDARAWIRPLIEIAHRTGCAILILAHLNQDSKQKKGIYRIAGSGDFVAASRSAMIMGCDPDNKRQLSVAHEKSNVGPCGSPIPCQIDDTGVLTWTGVAVSADRMFQDPSADDGKSALEECKAWILAELASGCQYSQDMERGAKAQGFSFRTMVRAKAAAGVKSRKDQYDDGGAWIWYIPQPVEFRDD